MQFKAKNQQGFLEVIAVILIVVVSFIAIMLASFLVGSTKISTNMAQSNSAFYLAKSGLELVKRDIIVNKHDCAYVTATYQTSIPITLLGGQFAITSCTTNKASTNTTADITGDKNDPSYTSIPVSSTAGFSNQGIIAIDNELINYNGISGGVFRNVTRGAEGTTVSAHTHPASVVQNQLTLVGVGAIPTIASPAGKRTIQEILPGKAGALGGYNPAVAALTSVSLGGDANVNNPGVTKTSLNFPGSTIVTNGPVNIGGNSATNVENTAGTGLETSSTSGNILVDVIQNQNPPLFTSGDDLFNHVFNQNKAYYQDPTHATQIDASAFLNTPVPTGNIFWVNGSIDLKGQNSATYGSPTNPVILIINGDLTFKGGSDLTVYGLLYVIGNVDMHGNAGVSGYGSIISENTITMQGTPDLTFNTAILSLVNILNPSTITSYSGNLTFINEVYQ